MNSKKYKKSMYEVHRIADLKELINSSAALYGEEPAFLEKDKAVGRFKAKSYREMKQDIDGLGTGLLLDGFKDKKIAVIGANSYKWAVSYFAVVNGLGVVVPIDRELRAGEMKNLLERSKVSAVIYAENMKEKLTAAIGDMKKKPEIISMGELDALIEKGRDAIESGNYEYVESDIKNEEMAVLLFTSGTTGKSKGVMLSHKNIAANVYNMSKYVKIQKGGVGLSVLPMHHTYEMTCHICTGLYQGMAIAICEGLKHIQKNMNEVKATVMLSVPLIFETMHKRLWKNAAAQGKDKMLRRMIELSKKLKLYNKPAVTKKMFSGVHNAFGGAIGLLIAGGAPINTKVIEDFQAMGFPMIQGYGMSECSPIVAVNKDRYSKPASTGLAMPETQVRIIEQDSDGVGEIICKGPSVMLGYYENEEASREALKNGWLHTGDFGYIDEDGFIYIVGRKKNVIVTKNGKNIYAEEIEFCLLENPYIEEIIIFGIDDEKSRDVVVKAEVFPNMENIVHDFGETDKECVEKIVGEAIEKLNDQMPNYKRIKRFDIRDEEFEKTTTRKIKRY